MGLTYNVYLNADKIFGCRECKAHLADYNDIVSRVRPPSTFSLDKILHLLTGRKNFRGQHGKAFLFERVVNVTDADPVERNMTTGRHIVRDISCRTCHIVVGWKYDKAYEPAEKYKEGKYILEEALLCSMDQK